MPSVFRTHYAGELSLALEGEVVAVSGWVKRIRESTEGWFFWKCGTDLDLCR